MPQCTVERPFKTEVISKLRSDRSFIFFLGVIEQIRVRHDVVTQQDGAAVFTRMVGIVWQNGGGIGTARLAKVGDDVVNAHRNIRLDLASGAQWQAVLDSLQASKCSAQLAAFFLIAGQDTQAEQGFHAVKCVTVNLVAADLCIYMFKPSPYPGGITTFVVIADEVAGTQRKISCKVGIIGRYINRGGVEQGVDFHDARRPANRIGQGINGGIVLA